MILYPAIDLKDGAAVRLVHGEMDSATIFNTDPAAQAQHFVAQGCEWLHLVDLNGAFAGTPVNAAPVDAILASSDVPAQLGGGIRDLATIEMWLEKGLARVILGTAAVEDPKMVQDAAKAFPDQIAVGIDARDGKVATKGWAERTDRIDAHRSGKIFRGCGRGCYHLYRHQPRRCDARPKHRRDCRPRPSRHNSCYRIGRCVVA